MSSPQHSGLKKRVRAKLSLLAKLQGVLVATRKKNDTAVDQIDQTPESPLLYTPTEWLGSFEKLIADRQGLTTFTEFLRGEYSEENITFWTACNEYNKVTDSHQRQLLARKIFTKYLSESATDPVNVDSTARKAVQMNLELAPLDIFMTTQMQIFMLMKTDSYRRFLKSDLSRIPCTCHEEDNQSTPCSCPDYKARKRASVSNGHGKKNGFIPRDSVVGLSELPDHLRLHVSNERMEDNISKPPEHEESHVRRLTLTVKQVPARQANSSGSDESGISDAGHSHLSPRIMTAECISSMNNMEQVHTVQPVNACHIDDDTFNSNNTGVQLESPTETSIFISTDSSNGKDITLSQEELDALIALTSDSRGDRMRRSISEQGHPLSPFTSRRISMVEIASAAYSMTCLTEEPAEDDVKLLTRLSNSLDHLIELESAGVDCELDQVTELCSFFDNDVLESVEIERFLETAESFTLSSHSLCESCNFEDAQVSIEEIHISDPEEVCQLEVEVVPVLSQTSPCNKTEVTQPKQFTERLGDNNG